MILSELRLVGCDPSLRNWGLAGASYNLETKKLTIIKLVVVCPVIPTGKQVRNNSRDLEAGFQLYSGVTAASQGAHAVFVEVPVGSQSA